MVFAASGQETMAMGPERSKPLHNFMLPCLKWGSQRHLRCMKVPSTDAAGDRRSPPPLTPRKRQFDASVSTDVARGSEKRIRVAAAPAASKHSPLRSGIQADDDGIDAVREKLMLDLKTEADRMKDAILRKEAVAVAADNDDVDVVVERRAREFAPTAVDTAAAAVTVAEMRPWNLRTRRAAYKDPAVVSGESGKGQLRIEEKMPYSSPSKNTGGGIIGGGTVVMSPKLKASPEKKMEKVKFSLPLARKEIEDDFMVLVGHRPPRRPKKRPRIVQRQLDSLFPGLWLSEVTADSYKVPEEEATKR
ncbi:hypothetical protein HN51_056731 [Arachis hypogaea]|uniref:DUF1639 family protein n=1 Tax=Arachis hypogaea TaxID=3818 RepID=A0A444XUY5_ARAHY|nr:uncharacterized protein LOC112776943 [Arachis hypogaea]QHN79658.1 uncharacterized protein DS421_19g671870 [Arachis hypogaea]RYQ93600.1 hypothetical protein Ahy_B09g099863 [Arachis hypogaea]